MSSQSDIEFFIDVKVSSSTWVVELACKMSNIAEKRTSSRPHPSGYFSKETYIFDLKYLPGWHILLRIITLASHSGTPISTFLAEAF